MLAAALSPLMAFLLFELALRVWLFSPMIGRHPCSPGWNHPQYLFMTDPQAGYRLRPFFQGTEINPFGDFNVPVKINSLGMRDKDLEAEVCGNCYRILLLGDSFTFGEGVRWEQSFGALLEQEFNAGTIKVQVFNGGVPAYSLRQSLVRLDSAFELARPSLVIVTWAPFLLSREYDDSGMVYLNGYIVQPALAHKLQLAGDNLFLSHYPPGSWRARMDLWTQSHSLAYFYAKNSLRHRLLRFLSSGPLKKPESLKLPAPYLVKPLDTVARMSRYCRERNAEFLFVVIGSNPEMTRDIEVICRENEVQLLSLAEHVFEKNSPIKYMLFRNDDHFNAAGHAHLAENLVPAVEQALRRSFPR